MTRYATVDIGTNTVLLLVAEIHNGRIVTIHEEQRIIRLGKNVDAHRHIAPRGFDACAAVLSEYKTIAASYGVSSITACGTSFLRDAGNREEFVQSMAARTGVTIEVISGEEEALWTFRGGGLVAPDYHDGVLVIDIGGGSTEFILGDGKSVRQKISLDIGAVRLTERFCKHDPVAAEEEKNLRLHVRGLLQEKLAAYEVTPQTLCLGVAGTVTTLAAMMLELPAYDSDKINGFVIKSGDLKKLNRKLAAMTIEERKSFKGLEPERADVIVAGAWILEESLDFFSLPKLLVSNYGLRYGLLLKHLGM